MGVCKSERERREGVGDERLAVATHFLTLVVFPLCDRSDAQERACVWGRGGGIASGQLYGNASVSLTLKRGGRRENEVAERIQFTKKKKAWQARLALAALPTRQKKGKDATQFQARVESQRTKTFSAGVSAHGTHQYVYGVCVCVCLHRSQATLLPNSKNSPVPFFLTGCGNVQNSTLCSHKNTVHPQNGCGQWVMKGGRGGGGRESWR